MKAKVKQGQPVLKVYIAPEEDMTVEELHRCLKIAVAHSGTTQQDYLFRRLMGEPGFRKAREVIQKEKREGIP